MYTELDARQRVMQARFGSLWCLGINMEYLQTLQRAAQGWLSRIDEVIEREYVKEEKEQEVLNG